MERIELDSTALAWVHYRPAENVLQVGMRNGKAYDYFGVPAETYRDLLAAESKGSYYNRHIRNTFRFQLIARRGVG